MELRSNPTSARSRRCGTRATAVPRPHRARPQQSSSDAVSGQVRSHRRRLWNRPSGSWAVSTNIRYCSAEVVELGGRRFAADDHQRPRDVVQAVAVLGPRGGALRVLVQPARVGEAAQVGEDRGRDLDTRNLRFAHELDHEASAMPAVIAAVAITR